MCGSDVVIDIWIYLWELWWHHFLFWRAPGIPLGFLICGCSVSVGQGRLPCSLHILQNSTNCKEVFLDPPILSNRRPKYLREYLVRAKIKNDATTTPRGISKCPSRRHCHTCQHIQDGTRTVTFLNTNKTFDIRQSLDCKSTNVIY